MLLSLDSFQDQHSILRIQPSSRRFLSLCLNSKIFFPPVIHVVFSGGDSWCPIDMFLKTLGAGLSFHMRTTLLPPLTSLQVKLKSVTLITVLTSHLGHSGTHLLPQLQTETSKQLSRASNKGALPRWKVQHHTFFLCHFKHRFIFYSSTNFIHPKQCHLSRGHYLKVSRIIEGKWRWGGASCSKEPTGSVICYFFPPNN